MRNLFLTIVLSMTALASTSTAAMSLVHAGGAMPVALAAMDGHDCPSCPSGAMGNPDDHGKCRDCAACGAVAREVPGPVAQPLAMSFSRAAKPRIAPLPASRTDTNDPPPPRV